jgi:hypothetical protein
MTTTRYEKYFKSHVRIVILSFLLVIIAYSDLSAAGNERATIAAFSSALDANNVATDISNSIAAPAVLKKSDVANMLHWMKIAVTRKESVDIELLNSKYNGWGDHFKSEFLDGLRLCIKGFEKSDTRLIQGQKLLNNWAEWYESNIGSIRKLKPSRK